MRLMVCAGASGGGVNPALAVLQAIDKSKDQILWVGSDGGMEADLVKRAGIPFTTVPAGGIHGLGLRAILNSFKLMRGYFAARKLIKEFSPDVLFFTGGYVAIPTGLAGRKIPTLLCLPDIEPGLAIKVLARFADRITVPAQESIQYFPEGKTITVTGYPIRSSLSDWDRNTALKAFKLSPDLPTLMVTGGSLGARSINQAILKNLPELLEEMQVIHITGNTTWPEVEKAYLALPEKLSKKYRAFPYLHDRMGAAFAAADLVISRAGASILGELPNFALPGILVPYPHAWRYQKVNADHLVQKNAAIMIKDEELDEKLLNAIQDLMQNKTKLNQMKVAMQSQAKPDAAKQIAELLLKIGSESKGSA
ncbi:MAG: undecaprenyldiphospho-muramoylpentapeptide beta-N-acetylglucosaminyltransferase [Chloroflexi bacterium]|nr:undecaprenyldiphospho-muramoylpentapeptide beta-N-acetylglucosaminyltransferase [Chloroflexota bacterium]